MSPIYRYAGPLKVFRQMTEDKHQKSWQESFKEFIDPPVITMLFLGFSAGIPILLIFSSLSLWLREAGVERSAVTFFSWAALGYSFKFIWAPLVDSLPLPLLTKWLGRRRSWMITSQIMIILSISGMAMIDPASSQHGLSIMAIAAVMLGFSSATQDIVIDAFRIESAECDLQAIMSSTYIAGYRIGMIVAGAGALFIASSLGSTKEAYSYDAWKWTYIIMALTMLVGIATTILRPEPASGAAQKEEHSVKDYTQFFMLFIFIVLSFIFGFIITADFASSATEFLGVFLDNKHFASFLTGTVRLAIALGLAGFVAYIIARLGFVNNKMARSAYIAPVENFFCRYGASLAILILSLVGLYRISDIVLGVISNVFYQDLGFTKIQIASVVKTFGLIMTIVGGFLGGILSIRFGVIKILFLGALLSAATNLLFLLLASMGNNITMLYLVISADNLSAGLASAAFVAFLSSLTDISFTAVQYAIFTSLMTLLPKVLGGYSGTMVDSVGYPGFFTITALMGVPVLFIVWIAGKKLNIDEKIFLK